MSALPSAATTRRDLSIKQVAQVTGQSPDTIGDLVRRGYFPRAYKAGTGKANSPIRIPAADVEAYRARQPRAAS